MAEDMPHHADGTSVDEGEKITQAFGQWQPIETAPKDGRSILGLFKSEPPMEYGSARFERWMGTQIVMSHSGIAADGFDTGWGFVNGGVGGLPDDWFEAWMPLPEPPTAPVTAPTPAQSGHEIDGGEG